MSFFGFDTHNEALERERQAMRAGMDNGGGGLGGGGGEELAVYNWGQEDYDGLGTALEERGDDFNDETFGVGPVGKDFDFTQAVSDLHREKEGQRLGATAEPPKVEKKPEVKREYMDSLLHGKSTVRPTSKPPVWDDKSPMAFIIGTRRPGTDRAMTSTPSNSTGASTSAGTHAQPAQKAIRTLEEIEAEMRAQQYQQQAQIPHPYPGQSPNVAQAVANHIPIPTGTPQQQISAELQFLRQQQAQSQLDEGLEHHMRMLHISQLQQHQAQRQEQLELQRQQEFELQRQQELELQRQQELELQRQQELELQHQQELELQRREQILLLQQQEAQRRELQRLEREEQIRLEIQRREQQELQLLQMQQQQQRHQALYETAPHLRQQHVRTPDQLLRQAQQAQAQQQRSFPNTPEPQLPVGHMHMTQQQQSQLMQQHLLAQLSQAGIAPEHIHLLDPAQKEAIMNEARRKIIAAERLDQKNRRRLAKMERMARYNDLMTQSDKDFITRIQVSQLVTADPYTEDFYAQVLNSLRRNGTGIRPSHRMSGRREHAMHRMAEQVYRIVENAKAREKEKGQNGPGVNPLQGVLGKTSGRSYKAAPRQLLQVDTGAASGSPTSSPPLKQAEAVNSPTQEPKESVEVETTPEKPITSQSNQPLTRRQALAIIENLFDYALEWENNKRLIPEAGTDAFEKWLAGQRALEAKMWEGSQVTAPLDGRQPHPLVSILQPLKGKKVMKRLTRVMDARQLRITMTLITRLFCDFDVIENFHLTESLVESPEKHEMEKQVHVFEEFVLEAVLPALAIAPLPFVSGQLQLLRDPVVVARTRPGIILLTHIFTRAAIIKDRTLTVQTGGNLEGISQEDVATVEDFQEWQNQFDLLFETLAPHFVSLFPSARIAAALPFGMEQQLQTSLPLDFADQPVWSFFASMAIPASPQQQALMVAQLREKVLENVFAVNQQWVDETQADLKLRNVNIFLHALGLDSSQINL